MSRYLYRGKHHRPIWIKRAGVTLLIGVVGLAMALGA